MTQKAMCGSNLTCALTSWFSSWHDLSLRLLVDWERPKATPSTHPLNPRSFVSPSPGPQFPPLPKENSSDPRQVEALGWEGKLVHVFRFLLHHDQPRWVAQSMLRGGRTSYQYIAAIVNAIDASQIVRSNFSALSFVFVCLFVSSGGCSIPSP